MAHKRPATNRLTDGRDDSARHLYFVKDAAGFHESQLGSLNGAPTVRVRIAGFPRTVIVDTGASISLIQPGVGTSEVRCSSITPFALTGNKLHVEGEQRVSFNLNGETYTHDFCVSYMATGADALLGTDFLRKMDAHLDFGKEKLSLRKASN